MKQCSYRVKILTGAVISVMAHSAVAQKMLEEVVVTAQKRQEVMQDIPVSLVVMGAEQLENFAITEISGLGGNVPNVQVSPHPNSASTPRVFIRGIGNFDDQITQDPSVAVYVDGVYVGRNQGMGTEVADIERIEVLRGPQGTLYGRNATGGAINFISKAPEIGQWGASQKLTFGSRNEFRSRTMVNIPVSENIAARVFYLASEKDGFVKNAGYGESTYGAQDHDAQRLDLLYQPSDTVGVRYSYDRSHMEDSPFYLAPTTPGVPPRRPSTSHAGGQLLKPGDITTSGHQLTVNWDLNDNLQLRSITAYRDLDSYVFQDYMTGTGRPYTPLTIDAFVDQDQFSQEIQLLGNAMDNRLEYTLGAYYFDEEGEGITSNNLPGFGMQIYSRAEIDNKALAVFGQAMYTPDVFEQRLHITAGLRWSEDQRKATLYAHNYFAGPDIITAVKNGAGDKTFDDLSPSLTIAYDLGESVNVYAKFASGYKSGGFNMRASDVNYFNDGFDEETLQSYEIGIKSEWFGNRLRTNAAIFRGDYKDIQVSAQTDLTDISKADILNAGQATIEGLELEMTALLAEDLMVSLQYGYLNADYDKIQDDRFGGDITDQFAFVNAPQHSYTVDVNYDIASTSVGLLRANINYAWQDEKYISASTRFGEYLIDDYGLLNARLTLEEIPGLPAGDLKLALWVRNLEDKEYSSLNAPGFGGYRAWGEERSYGVDLTWDF